MKWHVCLYLTHILQPTLHTNYVNRFHVVSDDRCLHIAHRCMVCFASIWNETELCHVLQSGLQLTLSPPQQPKCKMTGVYQRVQLLSEGSCEHTDWNPVGWAWLRFCWLALLQTKCPHTFPLCKGHTVAGLITWGKVVLTVNLGWGIILIYWLNWSNTESTDRDGRLASFVCVTCARMHMGVPICVWRPQLTLGAFLNCSLPYNFIYIVAWWRMPLIPALGRQR